MTLLPARHVSLVIAVLFVFFLVTTVLYKSASFSSTVARRFRLQSDRRGIANRLRGNFSSTPLSKWRPPTADDDANYVTTRHSGGLASEPLTTVKGPVLSQVSDQLRLRSVISDKFNSGEPAKNAKNNLIIKHQRNDFTKTEMKPNTGKKGRRAQTNSQIKKIQINFLT